jgi:hypothetical protein
VPATPFISTVQSWRTDRGRSYMMDKTQAGTAQLVLIDQTGYLDPRSGSTSPYAGQLVPNTPVKISAQNPCDGTYHDIFTGYAENWTWNPDQTENWLTVTLDAVDGFELLSRAEVVPSDPTKGTTTYVGGPTVRPQDRINAALNDAGWPVPLRNVFSGNIGVKTVVYNAQTSLLSVCQDAADAEFPNVANCYIDRWGRFCFRGRFARLDYATYQSRSLNANPPPQLNGQLGYTWNVGDRPSADTFGYAPINSIEWTRDSKNLINACLCTPSEIAQSNIAGQLDTDSTSIASYGIRTLSITDLLVDSAPANADYPGSPPFTDLEECLNYAIYYTSNYNNPVDTITKIDFKTIAPSDPLGPAWWQFVTGVEIGDVVFVHQANIGGGGFHNVGFFIEGIHNDVQLGGPAGAFNVPQWTMSLDLSPISFYSTFT